MTVDRLLAELDAVAGAAKKRPFGDVSVNRLELYRILDALRVTLPAAIRDGAADFEPRPPVQKATSVFSMIDELDGLLHGRARYGGGPGNNVNVNRKQLELLVRRLAVAVPEAIRTKSILVDDAFVARQVAPR